MSHWSNFPATSSMTEFEVVVVQNERARWERTNEGQEEVIMPSDPQDIIDDTIDVIEVIATNTVNPDTPNKMTYSLKDVASGEKLVQILYKHETL